MTTATVYGDDYEPLNDPGYIAALERDLLAHEQATREVRGNPNCDCHWCADKYTEDNFGRWRCQGCGQWMNGGLLCSNEVTHRLECSACLRDWRLSGANRVREMNRIMRLAERQGGFDRPAAFDEHGGEA